MSKLGNSKFKIQCELNVHYSKLNIPNYIFSSHLLILFQISIQISKKKGG